MLCGFSSLWWPFGWNWSYLGFLGIIWRTCGSKCWGEGGGIFPTLCVECCLVDTDICVVSWCISTKGAIGLSESAELNKQSQPYSKHDVIIAPKLVDFFHKGTIMWGFDVLALCEVGSTHKRPVIKRKLHEILMCKDCKVGIMLLWYRSHLLAVLLNYSLFMKYVPTQTFLLIAQWRDYFFKRGDLHLGFISNETVKGNWNCWLCDVKNFNMACHFDLQVQPIVWSL